MTTLPQTATVPFHGHQILTALDGDTVVVIMRPLVKALGLNWDTQRQRISGHPLLTEGARFILAPSEGGPQEMLALELTAFHGWLVTLETRRIEDPDRREMILRYQRESFQAIHDYWHHGAAMNPRAGTGRDLRVPAQANQVMQALKRETNPAVQRTQHAFLVGLCASWDIEPPTLDEIIPHVPTLPDLAVPFFAALDALTAQGVRWNHSRRADQIAVNLKEVMAHFAAHGVQVVMDTPLRSALKACADPAFVGVRTVNSGLTGRSVKCWVFRWTP